MPRATVWLLDLDRAGTALPRFRSWLSPSEQARLAGFVRPQRAAQFVAGRGLLRLALSRALDIAPDRVTLEECPGRAPRLAAPLGPSMGFSISHSGRWASCAVGRGTSLGLDIELRDPARDIDALAAHAFLPDAQAWLSSRAGANRVNDFYRLWSEQEAAVKLHAPCAQAYALAHGELAIALCSSRRLAAAPELVEVAC